jgi:ADP-ribose pyrophosphatase
VDETEIDPPRRIWRDVVAHPGATAILALTTSSLSDPETKIVLVRQYRHAVREFLWEIPAGTLEPGEEILDCARRELLEETGLQAVLWKPLSTFYTAPGFCDEQMHLYLATSASLAPLPTRPAPPEDEMIEIGFFSIPQARQMIREGQIKDAKTLVGLLALETILTGL